MRRVRGLNLHPVLPSRWVPRGGPSLSSLGRLDDLVDWTALVFDLDFDLDFDLVFDLGFDLDFVRLSRQNQRQRKNQVQRHV